MLQRRHQVCFGGGVQVALSITQLRGCFGAASHYLLPCLHKPGLALERGLWKHVFYYRGNHGVETICPLLVVPVPLVTVHQGGIRQPGERWHVGDICPMPC